MTEAEKVIEELDGSTGFFETKGKRNIFIPKRLAEHILRQQRILTLKGSEDMLYYSGGIYKEGGSELVKEICAKTLGKQFTLSRYRETKGYIQGVTYVEPDALDNGWLNLENGLLNPQTKEFIPHSPDIFTINRIPISYDPKAKCPLFEEKLTEKVDSRAITLLQEAFGYCYIPGQPFQVAFLAYGPRRSMKSTALGVLGEMLGDKNITAFPLQQLTADRFATAYLFGKAANICADLDSAALKDTGAFMTITGGDPITAAKKMGHSFTFRPSAKLIFSCNRIPATSNKNLAFYRRWILIPFLKETPEGEIDPQLKSKLLKELPGILNWALAGLDRLVENGKLSYWLTENEVKDLYEKQADSISSFIFNCISTEDDAGKLTKREVYREYAKFCQADGLLPETPNKFGRDFKASTGCGPVKINGLPGYLGVSFKKSDRQSKVGDHT